MGPDTERDRAERISDHAARLSPAQRRGYVDRECAGDERLRAEVFALLEDRPTAPELSAARAALLLALDTTPDGEPEMSEPAADAADLPEALFHFRPIRELGRGGMGRVYLAHDRRLGRRVALKLLPEEFARDPLRLELFAREARTAARLNHPNIATIHDLHEKDGLCVIAMEHVEGRPLSALTGRGAPWPTERLLDVAIQVARGLAAAHEKGIVHRDLKPGNLMLDDRGLVKILDFGLAKALHAEAAAPRARAPWLASSGGTGSFGTPGYASPEQCAGRETDRRCDLFSFGVVLYELATGVCPFLRSGLEETIRATLGDDPKPASSVNPGLPPRLASLVDRLLAKQPEDRPASAAEVLEELETLRRDLAARPIRRWRAAGLTLAGVGALAAAAAWLVPDERDPRVLEASLELLHGALAEGDEESAAAWTEQLCGNQAGGESSSWCRRARELQAEAASEREHLRRASSAFARAAAEESWDDAFRALEGLSAREVEGRAYAPAEAARPALSERLSSALESAASRLSRRLETAVPGAPTAALEEQAAALLAHLRDAAPESPYLPTLASDLEGLRNASALRELRDEASAEQDAADLRATWSEMVAIDEDHPMTREVQGLFEARKEQQALYRVGLDQFRTADAEALGATLRGLDQERGARPNAAVEAEFAELREARAWLIAFARHAQAPEAREAFSEAPDPQRLGGAFREAARQLLESARIRRSEREARGEAERLRSLIERDCEAMRFEEAERSLAKLEALEGGVAESDRDAARELVAAWSERRSEWTSAEERRPALLKALAAVEEGEARALLAELESSWRDEHDAILAALAAAPRAGLQERLAVLALRLGEATLAFESAGDAAEAGSGERPLLLAAQARLLRLRLGRDPPSWASAEGVRRDLDAFFARRAPDATALYLRAVLEHEWSGRRDARRVLADLGAATGRHGLDSADAWYRAGQLRNLASENETAIELASRALRAPFTEAEVLVSLGGYRAALERGVRNFRRNVLVVRAHSALLLERYESAVGDLDRAIALDSEHAFSHYLRGLARGEAGEPCAGVADLRAAESLPRDEWMERVAARVPGEIAELAMDCAEAR